MDRPSLIDTLSVQWDLWIEQYRAFFPTNKEDVRDCLQLAKEAGTVDGLWGEGSAGQLKTLLAACQDTRSGKLIASLHLADATQVNAIKEKAEQYQLGLFDEERLAGLAIFSQLSIHPAHQKSQAAMVLLSHCFIEVLKAGGQAALMSCDPGHYSIFKRLGMRPIGPLSKTPEGLFRIPMAFLPDHDYFSIIHSPILPLMRGVDFEVYQPLCQWYYQLVRENSALQAGSAYYPNEEDFESHHTITEGLTEKGREAFLKNAVVIHCREGEVLITENDGGKAFGFVRKGLVKVVIGGKTVVLLGEGDIFGEIAFILHTKRTAQVVAASPDTEVVLFSESAINTLKEDADRAIIWRNLARVLAQRVVLTNKLLTQ
ncbi:MAG: cyclic nucleotide-binding domain-containing protein [Lewinellaceae bacterium]|nr:cyclic nucleotide-binding domain-containing protein [Phaeodactylibacter sp.]MCB9037923.1 cyclic nucleotide-binding domain-containing protein [Lewinellaceae bacterium]